MMNMEFQKRSISQKERKYPIKKILWILAAAVVIFYGIKFFTSGSSFKEFIFSFGEPLKADKDGYTNFVLMGTGGELHEGADLTDSIIVASLDTANKSATLLSIPRDLYVDTTMGDEDRINKIYTLAKNKYQDSEAGLKIMEKVVSNTVGIDIHYYVKVNFDGFAEVIDEIGGIDMYIDETIDDPFYPKEGTIGYDPFYLSKGNHHLDGETALKYSRSRKTTSDFDRSYRQQKVLFAIKEKVSKDGISNDPDKIKNIFFSLKDDIETDLSIRELINLASISKEITRENIKTHILHDDPSQCGGFLYTPQRKLYGGAFVLVPASDPFNAEDDYKYLHFFMQEIFRNQKITKENTAIQILNGTPQAGLAGQAKVLLQRHCLNPTRFGNAQDTDIKTTSIYAKTENALNSETIKIIRVFLEIGDISTNVPQKYLELPYASDAEIIIELGEDYAENPNMDPFDYLVDMETYEGTEDAGNAEETAEPTEVLTEEE